MGWTLKKELADRGLTIEQACKICRFDYQTMCILVEGGKTLPQLALKVANGLGLTMEQVKVIGQELKSPIWPKTRAESKRKGLGIEPPSAIDMDQRWYEKIGQVEVTKPVPIKKPPINAKCSTCKGVIPEGVYFRYNGLWFCSAGCREARQEILQVYFRERQQKRRKHEKERKEMCAV